MANPGNLSNDELQRGLREHLVELERRLVALDDQTSFNLAKRAHGLLERVEKRVHKQRQIAALSIGGDKGD